MTSEGDRSNVRYEPDEKPPMLLTVGLGVQFAVLVVAGIILTPAIVIRVAGGDEVFLVWAAFAALLVSGLTTILQAKRLGPIGAGYILIMGTSGAFIAVSVTALSQGGPAMLATLVFASSLVQFSLARRLSLLRRIFTPAVTGTVIMLIPVTVMPIIFDTLVTVPEGTPPFVAPLCAAVTLGVIVAVAFVGSPILRLWALIIGIVAGCVVSALFGLYDTTRITAAGWIGIPVSGWPGYDLSFGPSFWSLLAAFIFVTYIGAIETVGDAVAIQSVSWRRARAIDYREVQGAVAADGVGNLLSGLAGTIPNTTYSTSIAVTELTGVAARRIGIAVGAVLAAVAIVPKFAAVVLAIPGPGRSGLSDGSPESPVHGGNAPGRPGGSGLPQGYRGGCILLDWIGIPAWGHLFRSPGPVVVGSFRQRDDSRRDDRHFPYRNPEPGGPEERTHDHVAPCRCLAGHWRIPGEDRIPLWLEPG